MNQKLPLITKEEIDALRKANHVVCIYPRKKIAVVDGFKRYQVK